MSGIARRMDLVMHGKGCGCARIKSRSRRIRRKGKEGQVQILVEEPCWNLKWKSGKLGSKLVEYNRKTS